MALVDVNEAQIQNVQELASMWGDIRNDIEGLGGELVDAYAILGDRDFLVLFDAEDREAAFQIAVAVERYGLDMQTMEIIPMEEFAQLVDDL